MKPIKLSTTTSQRGSKLWLHDLSEVQLVTSIIDYREPNIVGFFIVQCADFLYHKMRLLELYYNFSDDFAALTSLKNS